MAYVLRGTASFPDGAGELTRYLDLPAQCVFGATGIPISYLSSVKTADPADSDLFDLVSTASVEVGPPPGPNNVIKGYLGGRNIQVYYRSTATGPIDVEFELVWGEPGNDVELGYNGE